MYCAIIGDIIQSKELADRAGVQAKLQETLTQINRRYEKVLASDCTITLGDEFQALLYTPVPAFELMEEVQRRMHPVRLRFGVGVGEITTPISRRLAIGADGPAYHYARAMIDRMKESERGRERPREELLYFSGDPGDGLINAAALLYRQVERDWTGSQREKIAAYLETGGTQESIAARLNVSQSSVNRAFKSARLYEYRYALEQIRAYLESVYGRWEL